MKPFSLKWLLIYTVILMVFGCSSEIPNELLDKSAKQIVLDLENKSRKNISSKSSVYIISFTDLVNNKPSETSKKTLFLLNHHISNSNFFRLLEFDENQRKALLQMLLKNESYLQDNYYKPELGKFINLQYVLRGGVEKNDNNFFVRVSMTSLETGEILHSSQVSFKLQKTTNFYFYILIGLGILFFSLYKKSNRFVKRIDTTNILQKKCASCGKKINSINTIGGQCLTPVCENDICVNCWNETNSRYCTDCTRK